MKRVQVLNAVLLAAGAAMALVLSVVCLIYGFYVSSVPRLRVELEALLVLSAAFWAMAGGGALAFLGHRNRSAWRWLAQPLPLLPLAGIGAWLLTLN